MADIYVGVGEWMVSLKQRMNNASLEDTIHLPTRMHLHAFNLLQESDFIGKEFKVDVLGHPLKNG